MQLSIPEKFLILAQHPSKGRFLVSGVPMQHGLIGSLLLEMSIRRQIDLQGTDLVLKSGQEKDQPLLQEIRETIRKSARPRTIKYWIRKLALKSNRYKWVLITGLHDKRIVRIERRKFLGIIPYRSTYLTDRRKREGLIKELKSALHRHHDATEEILALLGLVEACKMHRVLSGSRDELRAVRKSLKSVIRESPISGTVDKTIKEVQSAVMVAIISSAAVSSGGSR